MSRKIFSTLIAILFAVVGFFPIFSTRQVSAASPDVLFYYDPSPQNVKTIGDSISKSSGGGFDGTFLGIKGGLFDGKVFQINSNLDQPVRGDENRSDYMYSSNYYCPTKTKKPTLTAPAANEGRWTYEVSILVSLPPSNFNHDSRYPVRYAITHITYDGDQPAAKNNEAPKERIHWEATGGDQGAPALDYGNMNDQGGDSKTNAPSSCLTGPFQLGKLGKPGLTGNSEIAFVKPGAYNYNLLSAAQKNSWKSIVDKGKGAVAATATTNGNATGGTNDSPSCESNGSVLGWLLCPLINGVADALNSLYSGLIQPLLRTRPLILTPNSGDPNKTYDVWNNFRIYGNILLVIVLLIVVFGESIGGGLIDAYTARKILPRLLIGAILINLSIYIVAFGMDVANILGNGLQSLIQAPFQAGNDFKLNIFGASPGFSDDALGIVGVIGGLWAVAAVWGPISFLMLFILVPTLIVMALIVGILLIRQGLILLLIFAAPIAFALWCLPNTEQYFKRWWDTLFRTLLIYPIVAVIFAMANVLSVTISNTTSSLKVFSGLLAVICLFAPLYLIPFSFQIAGGIMGTLGNIGKRVSAGGMGWAKGARGNTAKSNIQKMKQGDRFNQNGAMGRFNKWQNDRVAGVAGGAGKGFGFGKRGAAYRSNLRAQNAANASKNAALAARAGDQNALAVLASSGGTGSGGRAAARALQKEQGWSDEETTRAFHAARDIGFNGGNVGAAMKLHGANPSDKIRTKGAVGIQKHIEGLKQSAITANGGDTSAGDRAVFDFNTAAKESGQLDMSAETVDKAWQMSTVGQHVTGKPESLRTFTDHFAEVLANPEQFAPSEVEAAAVGIAEIDAQKSGASDVNRATINEALFDRMGLDDQSPVSIPDQIAGKLAGTSGGRNVPAETIRKRYRAAAAPTMGGGGPAPGPSGGGGGQPAPPSSPPAPGPAGSGGSRVQPTPQAAPPKRNGSQPLYLDVGSKKVRVSEDEYLAAQGHDPRVRQGPNGEDAVVTAPVGGMKYQWQTFDTPGGRKSRVLQEVDSSGKVVRPNVVLEAAKDSGYNYNYNQATKKTSLVDSGGNVVFDGVPADWVGWHYGESPISRRGAEKLKEASQSNDDTTLTIDHSTSDKKLSSGDLLKGANEAVTESKKKA